MLTIKTRPYHVAEKKAVSDESITGYRPYVTRSIFTGNYKSSLNVLVPVFFLLIAFIVIMDIFEISGSGEVVVAIMLGLIGLFFITWLYFTQDKIESDKAEVIHVITSRAIKKENPFGPGMAFYIDVLDGNRRKTLYLYGQHLEDMDRDKKFPSTEFKIVRSFKTKQVINFLVLGKYFAAEKNLPAFTKEELQGEQDIRVLDIAIDEVQ